MIIFYTISILIVIGYLVIFLPLFQQFFYFPLVFLGCFLLILRPVILILG